MGGPIIPTYPLASPIVTTPLTTPTTHTPTMPGMMMNGMPMIPHQALGPINTSMEMTRDYEVRRGDIKPKKSNPQPQPQPAGMKKEKGKEREQKIALLEDALAAVGSVEAEDMEGMEEEDKIEYLREFITPVVASIELENPKALADRLLKMEMSKLLEAMQSADAMLNAIEEVNML